MYQQELGLKNLSTATRKRIMARYRQLLHSPAGYALLTVAFIIAGMSAIFLGQTASRLLSSIGLSSGITVWMVPLAPIMVVVIFYKLFQRLGLKI